MEVRVSAIWVVRNFEECLARVEDTGDRLVLVEDGKPVAALVPVAGSRRATLRQVWDAVATIRADASFADDLLAVNNADRILDNPWDSP